MRQNFARTLGISALGHIGLLLALSLTFLAASRSPTLTVSPIWISVEQSSSGSSASSDSHRHRKKISKKAEPATNDMGATKESASDGKNVSAANVTTYQNRIRAILEERIRYPEIARRLRQEGEVVLAMEVEQSGKVLWSKLQSPSPFSSLNASALESVSKIERFPPLPHGKATLVLEIPLIFAL